MIVCGACGRENPAGTEFCQSCGRFLEWTQRPAEEPNARPPQRPNVPDAGPVALRDPVVTIDEPTAPVLPGDSLVLTGVIRNVSSIVDRVDLSIVGPSAAWWKVEPAVVSLYPATEAEVRLEFRPPKGPELQAGTIPVGLRAQASPPDGRMATAEIDVVVSPAPDVTTEIVPRSSRGLRAGRHIVGLTNRGNAPWRAAVRAVDPDARLRLQVVPETVEVAAGDHGAVTVTAGGQSFNFFGPPDVRPFVVELRPVDGGRVISHDARFEQQGLVRGPPLAIAGAVLAIAVVAVGVAAGWIPPKPPAESPSGSNETPAVTATPTATAAVTAAVTVQPSVTPEVSEPPEETPEPTPPVADWAIAAADRIGGFGEPVGVTIPTHDDLGRFQAFENGVVYLRPDGNAVPMYGDILGRWTCLLDGATGLWCYSTSTMPPGIVDTLGYPLDREQFQEGEPYQLFDNGGIYCYQGCGSAVFTPLEPVWQQLREMGIGLPVRDVVGTEQLGGGWLGRFVNGFIITDPDGADYVSCTYDGDVIATNLPLTDCYGFAAYVRSLD